MERCRACGAPVEHSAPDGDLKYYPAAASRSRQERERIIAALQAIMARLDSPHADKVFVAKDYTKADLLCDLVGIAAGRDAT